MTIKVEQHPNSVNAAKVFCNDCDAKRMGGRTLAQIHNGYGSESEPVTQADMDALMAIAITHDKQHPEHIVRVMRFTR